MNSLEAQYKDFRVKSITQIDYYYYKNMTDTVVYTYNYENGKLSKIVAVALNPKNDFLNSSDKVITFNYDGNIITSTKANGKAYKEFEFDKNNNLIRHVDNSGTEHTMKYANGKLVYYNENDIPLRYSRKYNVILYKGDKFSSFTAKNDLYDKHFYYSNGRCFSASDVQKNDTTDLNKKYITEWQNDKLTKITYLDFASKKEVPISANEFFYDNSGKIIREQFYSPYNKEMKLMSIYNVEYENQPGNDSILYKWNNWKINTFFKQRTYVDDVRIMY